MKTKKTNIILCVLILCCIGSMLARNFGEASRELQRGERILGTAGVSVSPRASEAEKYQALLAEAKKLYPNQEVDIRNLKVEDDLVMGHVIVAFAIDQGSQSDFVDELIDTLVNRIISNIPPGSIVGVEDVVATSDAVRTKINDNVTDILLDKKYRVVEKGVLNRTRAIVNTENAQTQDTFSITIRMTEQNIRATVTNITSGEIVGSGTMELREKN